MSRSLALAAPRLSAAIAFVVFASITAAQPPRPDDPVARHERLLAEALGKRDKRQALEAMRLLARYPDDPRVLKALVTALRARPNLEAAAAAHLAGLGRRAAVPPLIARARSKAVWKKPARLRPLLTALASTGDGRAAPLLFKAMKHPDIECARAAINGMAGLRARRRAAVERMIAYLESLGGSVRDMRATTAKKRYDALSGDLVGCITALTGQSFTADTTTMRRWWKKNKRKVKDRLKADVKKRGKAVK